MHDLIARNRVAGYHEGDLMRHLHGDGGPPVAGQRVAFEHHVPGTGILVAFALEAWPHLLAAMRDRTRRARAWSGRLSPREAELAERMLAEIAARGPLNSDAVDDDRRAKPFWGRATLSKATLQKLFFHGRLLIARREGTRRLYDRVVTARLWGFDYTWEVYTPSHKRVRGYYALPVLAGTEIVGHIDPKADRAGRKLVVLSRRVRRGHAVAASVQQLAAFLGLR